MQDLKLLQNLRTPSYSTLSGRLFQRLQILLIDSALPVKISDPFCRLIPHQARPVSGFRIVQLHAAGNAFHHLIILSLFQNHLLLRDPPSGTLQIPSDRSNLGLGLKNQFFHLGAQILSLLQNPYTQSTAHAGNQNGISLCLAKCLKAVGEACLDPVLQMMLPDVLPGPVQRPRIHVHCHRGRDPSCLCQIDRNESMIRSDIRKPVSLRHQ